MVSSGKDKGNWKNPALGYATYLSIRDWIVTLWLASIANLAIFAGLAALLSKQPWLKATVAEGMVLAGFFLIATPILALLAWAYMGRKLKARMVAENVDIPTGETKAEPYRRGHRLWLAGLFVLCAALLWVEYAYQTPIAERRANPTTLDRALFGDVSPSYAGVVGFVIITILTFMARGMWERRRNG